ncbi:hypothetical protein [Henriciella litoralis]|uniref:hypothetical protein n=1 Tax=Henriciella litoralis TaxID=568102 RepID=UPI000A03B2BB|nr:hypothetical protein [Henriciella litoralis]
MRGTVSLLAAALAFAATSGVAMRASAQQPQAGLDCKAMTGTAEILGAHDKTFLIFGELHGTREAPAAFGEIACEAAQQGPIVIGIEQTAGHTPLMQDFVDSEGNDDDRHRLLRRFFDGSDWGLSSQAFLDLFVRLQKLREAGADIRMIGFKNGEKGADGSQAPYEKSLAESLMQASAENPDARVLVLTGNLHARREAYGAIGDSPGFLPMAMHLPDDETLTFNIQHPGGEAHTCQADGCGPHAVSGREVGLNDGLYLFDTPGTYHGTWNVGPISASPPIGKMMIVR